MSTKSAGPTDQPNRAYSAAREQTSEDRAVLQSASRERALMKACARAITSSESSVDGAVASKRTLVCFASRLPLSQQESWRSLDFAAYSASRLHVGELARSHRCDVRDLGNALQRMHPGRYLLY
ncbi:hypothetical protein PsYK624_157570 [Phanerochaete sordida]|uniref:Uncharacterized protein n=1 Tax=Phanerochaete sordida TaxID=48140 RepID=A0A9P3LLA5_9APHY|nr:hypothetical protein PsYK624_157570 [Phanerochaete sordida]